MKYHIAVFVLAYLLVTVSVFPSVAQDDMFAPEQCNEDEVQQVTDTALEWGDQMNAVAQTAFEDTLEGNVEKMLNWGELYVSFFNDIYPDLPNCIDGVIYSNAVGLMLSRQMNLETIIVLNIAQNETETGDADVNEALQATFNIQNELATLGVSTVNNVVNFLQSGESFPNWLPACTDDQSELGTQITELEENYADLQPALQAYLENGTVDQDTYIAMLNLVTDSATLTYNNPKPCSEYYSLLVNDVYTYNDTLTTLTLGQIAPYVSDDVNVGWFNDLLLYCNDALSFMIEGETTEESGS